MNHSLESERSNEKIEMMNLDQAIHQYTRNLKTEQERVNKIRK
jgi:hypothetical protein